MRETKLREALLAQHFEDVDQLANKIAAAASKVERSTALLNAVSLHREAVSKAPIQKPRPRWKIIGICAVAVCAGVVVSAGVGALIARCLPMQTPTQAQEADIGQAIVEAWFRLDTTTQTKVWNALDSHAQESLAYSLRGRK